MKDDKPQMLGERVDPAGGCGWVVIGLGAVCVIAATIGIVLVVIK